MMVGEPELVEVDRFSDLDSDNELLLVKKSRVKSVIWKYFGVKDDKSGKPVKEDIDKPVCKLCKKPIPAKRSNTMNLFHHLQEYHPDAYSEAVPYSSKVSKPKQKQPMLKQVINKAKKYDTKSTNSIKLLPTTWPKICSLCMQ